MPFLDSSRPIATCSASDCTDCPVAGSVHCHFRPAELVHFLLISLPTFLVGGAGVLSAGWLPLAVWVAVVVGFFGFVEIRVLCSHCPHYAEEGPSLRCWANHGSPKLWKYRPGPMSSTEKTVLFAGFVVAWGYPLAFFVHGGLWFLLGVYLLMVTGFFVTLKVHLCSKCMNFACPLNSVPNPVRVKFFERNPVVADAWNTHQTAEQAATTENRGSSGQSAAHCR